MQYMTSLLLLSTNTISFHPSLTIVNNATISNTNIPIYSNFPTSLKYDGIIDVSSDFTDDEVFIPSDSEDEVKHVEKKIFTSRELTSTIYYHTTIEKTSVVYTTITITSTEVVTSTLTINTGPTISVDVTLPLNTLTNSNTWFTTGEKMNDEITSLNYPMRKDLDIITTGESSEFTDTNQFSILPIKGTTIIIPNTFRPKRPTRTRARLKVYKTINQSRLVQFTTRENQTLHVNNNPFKIFANKTLNYQNSTTVSNYNKFTGVVLPEKQFRLTSLSSYITISSVCLIFGVILVL
ncbi:unnamed protein product [Candida verbasci]|uniref:Uncharacterized protein n=1 Tax=Candida verbasci TaxID=1227364 RepID=A0A9W4TYD6_9ASCO|nr:unnamed protein product [Candida verbasci]